MGLLAARADSVAFANIGDAISGTVTKPYEDRVQTEIGSDRPKLDKNGRPMMMAVIELQTDERADANDDGKRIVYAASINMQIGIREAVTAAGAADLEVGGRLTIRYASNAPSSTPGFNPIKQYEVSYVRPAGSLGGGYSPPANGLVDAARTTQIAATTPQAPPVAQGQRTVQDVPLPAAPLGHNPQEDMAKIKELAGYGLQPAMIQAALPHLTLDAVTAILAIPA